MNNNPSPFSGSNLYHYEAGDLDAMMEAVNYYHWILGLFEPYLGESILDVGAGIGNFSTCLLDKWQQNIRHYIVLEPEAELYQKVEKRLDKYRDVDIRCYNGFLSDVSSRLSEISIDTILYVNVLEHIENDRAELERAATLLDVDGHLLSFTPAMPILYSRYDKQLGHYRRYTLSEMKRKIDQAGLTVVKAHYVDLPGFFLWWLTYRFLKHTKLGKKQVQLYDRLVVPLLKNLEPGRFLPFGKNVLVVAKK